MTNFKKITNVIPLTRVKLDRTQIFSYLVPLALQGQIRPGQLVRVPFHGRTILGVTSSPEMHRLAGEVKRYKYLGDLVDPLPILTEKNQALANWISEQYAVSLGIVVKAMIPEPAKTASVQEIASLERSNPYFMLTEDQRQAMNQIINGLSTPSEYLLYGPPGSGKTELSLRAIERVVETNQQAIILIPEISSIHKMVKVLAGRFGIDRLALLHGKLKDSERMWVWRRILAQEKQIIVGARSAIFAPVRNLGLVVMEEEHDASYKQIDQHPKYHTLDVARKLSELWGCPLILTDRTPSVATFYDAVTKKSVLIKLPHSIKADLVFPKVHVIDMKREVGLQNVSFLSEYLKLSILENLQKRLQVVLFLNKRGDHSIAICQDCGHVPACEDCDFNLIWTEKENRLFCHNCGKSYQLFSNCPVCGGARVRFSGFGIETVEKELKRILKQELPSIADKVRVETVDQQRLKKDTSGSTKKDWLLKKIQVLIGTQILAKGWDGPNVGLVGIVSADTLLHFPDFRSNEKTFQVLMRIMSLAGKSHPPGTVILQTYNPNNKAIQAVRMNDYPNFFLNEVEVRKKMVYPPFCKLVKLVVKDKDSQKAFKRGVEVVNQLLSFRPAPMQIIGPGRSFVAKYRGYYNYQIILKIRPLEQISIKDLLKGVTADFDVDVNPDSLL